MKNLIEVSVECPRHHFDPVEVGCLNWAEAAKYIRRILRTLPGATITICMTPDYLFGSENEKGLDSWPSRVKSRGHIFHAPEA